MYFAYELTFLSLSGSVYSWGYSGNGRLGLGEQQESNISYEEPALLPFFSHAEYAFGTQDEETDLVEDENAVCFGWVPARHLKR